METTTLFINKINGVNEIGDYLAMVPEVKNG